MKALLYCTKAKPRLIKGYGNSDFYLCYRPKNYMSGAELKDMVNGKIVGECDFEVEKITSKNLISFEKESCIDRVSMLKYLKPNLIWNTKFEGLLKIFGSLTFGYAIHIKNLKVFDKPKELSEFYKFVGIDKDINNYKSIEKAPQNMMYAYEYISEIGFSGTWNRMLNGRIIISIRPEWLCKILNGEKTIEVRKKVLKEML